MTEYEAKKVFLVTVDGDYLAPVASVAKSARLADIAEKANKDSNGNIIADYYELKLLPITVLGGKGSIILQDNTVYSMVLTGSTTFKLPTISIEDNSYLHQIFIQIKVTTPYSINFGTNVNFNKKSPDLSTAGLYNIYLEYDKNDAVWVCGAMKKGTAS